MQIDKQALMEEVANKWEELLLTCAINDPLENFEREQDHFIKYVDKEELQAWVDYNKVCKRHNYNKFGASRDKNFQWRDLVEPPSYICTLLEAKNPDYFSNTPEGLQRTRAFAKRNPLFCKAEVV